MYKKLIISFSIVAVLLVALDKFYDGDKVYDVPNDCTHSTTTVLQMTRCVTLENPVEGEELPVFIYAPIVRDEEDNGVSASLQNRLYLKIISVDEDTSWVRICWEAEE